MPTQFRCPACGGVLELSDIAYVSGGISSDLYSSRFEVQQTFRHVGMMDVSCSEFVTAFMKEQADILKKSNQFFIAEMERRAKPE